MESSPTDWRPQLSEVPAEFEEVQLPKAPAIPGIGPAPACLSICSSCSCLPGAKEIEEATKLVAAMQAPKMDERLLAMQTNKLRELIGRITNEKEKVNQAPMTEPEMGGVFRGAGEDATFPWRQFAQSINFAEDRPGVLILSSEGAAKSPGSLMAGNAVPTNPAGEEVWLRSPWPLLLAICGLAAVWILAGGKSGRAVGNAMVRPGPAMAL